MTKKRRSRVLAFTLTVVVATLMLPPAASAAPKYKILHAFGHGQDGAGAWGSLLFGAKGNLYGTTGGGGTYGYGTAFELMPESKGKWSESILHNFDRNGQDGYDSTGNLLFGGEGILYGTTTYGGAYDYGTVFELTSGSAGWTESLLFSFDVTDGARPYAGVVMDKNGNLYGTAGYVFELAPGAGGWTETVIYNFPNQGDGNGPFAGVILDPRGNLYGTTRYGGSYNLGVVYELTPAEGGGWNEQVLHDFCSSGPPHCPDGGSPGVGALTMDPSGNIYGTTVGGGCCFGTVFRLTPQGDGTWKETILYNFKRGASGSGPGAGVVRDKAGNLYGTTIYGGSPNCGCGVVYKLSPKKNGKWKYTVLHTFIGSDGAQPDANLILDNKGNLYGTAATAGPYGAGVVFEVTP
jgi:uncharacterized repeat protein (TIGR03803 family)